VLMAGVMMDRAFALDMGGCCPLPTRFGRAFIALEDMAPPRS
jgi:hypothetical protein